MFKGTDRTEKRELIFIDFNVFQVNLKGPWSLNSKKPVFKDKKDASFDVKRYKKVRSARS
jgi:hypothetical protein